MNQALSPEPMSLTVEARAHGWRIDHYLSRLFSNYSRALLQKSIADQGVLVNGLPVKAARRLRVNDVVSVRLPQVSDQSLPPEDIPLSVIFEDDALVVINKPPAMIVHPGRGNYRGTLAGALQFHFDRLSDLAGKLRPGIVHRLDKDTSGVIIVAKDNQVHAQLSAQFEQRQVRKEYRAIVHGVLDRDSDWIETYTRVNPYQREKMCVCEPGGNAREAVTFYEVLERFDCYTYVRLLPKTGRTHQLRVHMRHLGHPIVADRLYGGKSPDDLIPATAEMIDILGDIPEDLELVDEAELTEESVSDASTQSLISRQALHAYRLELEHPVTRKRMEFEAPLPTDIQTTLDALQRPREDLK